MYVFGEVLERSNRTVLKTVDLAIGPRVRISPSPQRQFSIVQTRVAGDC